MASIPIILYICITLCTFKTTPICIFHLFYHSKNLQGIPQECYFHLTGLCSDLGNLDPPRLRYLHTTGGSIIGTTPKECHLALSIKIRQAYTFWPNNFTSGNSSYRQTCTRAKWCKARVILCSIFCKSKIWTDPKSTPRRWLKVFCCVLLWAAVQL